MGVETEKYEVHRCDQAHRLHSLERKTEELGRELSDGRVVFAELRKDIHAVTTAIENLAAQIQNAPQVTALDKARDAAIFWLVPLALSGLFWAIVQSKEAVQ